MLGKYGRPRQARLRLLLPITTTSAMRRLPVLVRRPGRKLGSQKTVRVWLPVQLLLMLLVQEHCRPWSKNVAGTGKEGALLVRFLAR